MDTRRKALTALAFMLALLALSVSCTYLRQLVGLVAEKPQVRILDIETKNFTANRIELVFVLDVYNPNGFVLDIDRLDYQAQGLGVQLGKGSLIEPLVLKGEAHTIVRLPFTVLPEAAKQIFKKYLLNPRDLKLQLFAQLFLNTAFGKMDMRFEEEKTVMKGLGNF